MPRGIPTRTIIIIAALGAIAFAAGGQQQQPTSDSSLDPLKSAAVKSYAALVHSTYKQTVEHAEFMRSEIVAFLNSPSADGLQKCKLAWIAARTHYGRSEVFRFYGGPIDANKGGVETLINAWPIDEAYIDRVEGDPHAGIINNPEKYPTIEKSVLTLLNQRGGETHVALGWHAIEFLLWGQDHHETAAGSRPHSEYIEGHAPHAQRRGEYLRQITDLLLVHLHSLAEAWSPNASEPNYRTHFEHAPADDSVQKMLTGMAVLSGFEMAGERMAVAYETRDQEEEHSCFSDTTHLDFIANMRGIYDVYVDAGIDDLARAVDPTLSKRLDIAVVASRKAVESIVPPFDRAIRADDSSPERQRVLACMEALELQASLIAELAQRLEYQIPMEPLE